MKVAQVRGQIRTLGEMTYLDNAGAGLPPTRVTEAMKGSPHFYNTSEEVEVLLSTLMALR